MLLKSRELIQKDTIPTNTPAQHGTQGEGTHTPAMRQRHCGVGRAMSDSSKVWVPECLRFHSTTWETFCSLKAKHILKNGFQKAGHKT